MSNERENKKLYPFRFREKFKEEMDYVAKREGITTTALIEREVGRYLTNLKRAATEMKRRKEIEQRIKEEKHD